MVNVYIILTLVAAFILTVVFAGLLGWETSQQNKTIEQVLFPEWKHKNVVFEHSSTGSQTIPLSCPVDKHMFINNAVFQYYDPLTTNNNWDDRVDAYWISYGNVLGYPPSTNLPGGAGEIGQCDRPQNVAGFMNEACLNATGDCTVSVSKDGTVPWSDTSTLDGTICSTTAKCITGATDPCKFSVNISYVCTTEEEVQRLVQFSKSNA